MKSSTVSSIVDGKTRVVTVTLEYDINCHPDLEMERDPWKVIETVAKRKQLEKIRDNLANLVRK